MTNEEMSSRYIINLQNECKALEAENKELKCYIEELRNIVEDEGTSECGCVVIEGSRTSAAYQDIVGILLANDYAVELIPMDGHRKLKVIIKESEVRKHGK